ncbi:MAG: hypothetical protein WDM89_19655 [Rhizomicrobium sp.]
MDHRAPPFDHPALHIDRTGLLQRWIADFIVETSYFARVSSGSFSIFTNMVGTHWLAFAWYCSMRV